MLTGKKLTDLRRNCHQYIRPCTHKTSFKVIKPDFHPMINNASKRILRKYIESSKLADAHLLGHGYVTETQKQAYKNLDDKRVELESKKAEELEKIKQLTKTVTDLQIKLAEKIKRAAQVGAKATKVVKQKRKKQIKTARKALSKKKKKLKNLQSSLYESKIYQLFKQAKSSLLEIPGENEMKLVSKLENIGAEETKVKGGSLAGAESRALVKTLELVKLVFGEKTFQTPHGDVKIGSEVLEVLAVEYLKLKNEENLLTSQQQAFCIHFREKIRNLIGSTGRLSASYFSTDVKLLSDHIKTHWFEDLEINGEALGRDSQTEFLNQRALSREEALKYSKTFEQKTLGILQREHRSKIAKRSPKLRKHRHDIKKKKIKGSSK